MVVLCPPVPGVVALCPPVPGVVALCPPVPGVVALCPPVPGVVELCPSVPGVVAVGPTVVFVARVVGEFVELLFVVMFVALFTDAVVMFCAWMPINPQDSVTKRTPRTSLLSMSRKQDRIVYKVMQWKRSDAISCETRISIRRHFTVIL